MCDYNLNIIDLEQKLNNYKTIDELNELAKIQSTKLLTIVNDLKEKMQTITEVNETMLQLNKLYKQGFEDMKNEMSNHRRVSIVSNLSKQVTDRDKTIKLLNKKIDMYKTKIETASDTSSNTLKNNNSEKKTEDTDTLSNKLDKLEKNNLDKFVYNKIKNVESDSVDKDHKSIETVESDTNQDSDKQSTTASSDNEENIEFTLKTIDKVQYFISDEQPFGVYECTSDEDIGNQIGILKKNKIIRNYSQEKHLVGCA